MEILKPGEFAVTARACERSGISAQEDLYLQSLRETVSYETGADTLRLKNAEGRVVLTFERELEETMDPAGLVGTVWSLRTLSGRSLVAGSIITLAFEQDSIHGFASCRGYTGEYQAERNKIHFPRLSMVGTECGYPELLGRKGSTRRCSARLRGTGSLQGNLSSVAKAGTLWFFDPDRGSDDHLLVSYASSHM